MTETKAGVTTFFDGRAGPLWCNWQSHTPWLGFK
jgi:hypothetical protein